jgi:hypothetical protein
MNRPEVAGWIHGLGHSHFEWVFRWSENPHGPNRHGPGGVRAARRGGF